MKPGDEFYVSSNNFQPRKKSAAVRLNAEFFPEPEARTTAVLKPSMNVVTRDSDKKAGFTCKTQPPMKLPEDTSLPMKNTGFRHFTEAFRSSVCEVQTNVKLPETKSRPRKKAVACKAAQNCCSEQNAQNPTSGQKSMSRPSKDLTICHSAKTVSFLQETPVRGFKPGKKATICLEKLNFEQAVEESLARSEDGDLEPKRKIAHQARKKMSNKGKPKKNMVIRQLTEDVHSVSEVETSVKLAETKSQPKKKAVACKAAQTCSSGQKIQTPVSGQKAKSCPSKDLTVCHSANMVSFPQETPMQNFKPVKNAVICEETLIIDSEQEGEESVVGSQDGDLEPKRKRANHQSNGKTDNKGKLQTGISLREAASQTEPVVIFVGNVGMMANSLKQLEQWNGHTVSKGNTVSDGSDVLIDLCNNDELKKQVEPCLQLQQPVQQQESDDDVICLGGTLSPVAARTESGIYAIGPDEGRMHDLDGKAEHNSNERQWQISNNRQEEFIELQDLTDEVCRSPSEKQLNDHLVSEEQQGHSSTRLLRQGQSARQGQDQTWRRWQAQGERQWQCPTERQWQGPTEKQWQGTTEMQWQDQGKTENQWKAQNEVLCEDQNMTQCQDRYVFRCQGQIQYQDQNVALCHSQITVQHQNQSTVQSENRNVVLSQSEILQCQNQSMVQCEDRNVVPCQDEDVAQSLDQNVVLCEDENVAQCRDENVVQCRDHNTNQWQDPTETQWQVRNKKQRQDQNKVQSLLDQNEMQYDQNEVQYEDAGEIQHLGPNDKQDQTKMQSASQWLELNDQMPGTSKRRGQGVSRGQRGGRSQGRGRSESRGRSQNVGRGRGHNESQGRGQSESRSRGRIESLGRGQNEGRFRGQSEGRGRGKNEGRGRGRNVSKWQDPNERNAQGSPCKQGCDLYTELRANQPRKRGRPRKTPEPETPWSMLTVFKDCMGSVEVKRGRGVKVRGGAFQRGRAGVFMPALGSPSGSGREWDETELNNLSDSGVLYQELNQSQSLTKKRKVSRRGAKPRAC